MPGRFRIVVVSTEVDEQFRLVSLLQHAGHDVTAYHDFHTARRVIDERPPDLLIADVRLGEYNGLHLAIRARLAGSGTASIVTGPADPVLAREAERNGTTYLVRPFNVDDLVARVNDITHHRRRTRRSMRKRIAVLAALVADDRDALLIDLSYEGLRLLMRSADEDAVARHFTLRIPSLGIACVLQRVWTGSANDRDLWCGAALAMTDAGSRVAWRAFVDAVPGASAADEGPTHPPSVFSPPLRAVPAPS